MASVCMSQNNFQQHHYEVVNGNMILLQQQQVPTTGHYGSKLQAIAPAQTKILGTSNLQNIQHHLGAPGAMLAKKKYTYANIPYGEQLPSVARRNARERNRVKQVNNGFANLRQHIPQTIINTLSSGGRGASKKLSKVDTLRIAVEYIRGLQDLLDTANPAVSNKIMPQQLYDESSNDGSQYGYSIDSPADHQSYHMTHSPTSSYSDSEISVNGANSFVQTVKLEEPDLQEFKFDFSEQHDDEELLDYISSWQDQ